MFKCILDKYLTFLLPKRLADKCGLQVKDICAHTSDGNTYMTFYPYNFPGKYRCTKCDKWFMEKVL